MTNKKEIIVPKTAWKAKQLTLFQYFVGSTSPEELSNTIELWDSLPKYSVSAQAMNHRRTADGYLPLLEKIFFHKGTEFSITISPALIKKEDGSAKAFYPSANEELVEDALRKLASEQNHGFYDQLKPQSGVTFSIRMLRKELKLRGHSRSQPEIIHSLRILARSNIEIKTAEGENNFAEASYLPGLAAITREDWQENPGTRWVAQFHPLVTDSIDRLTYRQYNYHLMMSHSSQLARWIHKRMAHNFVQASQQDDYHLLLTSVKRDSGLLEYQRPGDQRRKLEETLDELKKNKVLQRYAKEERRGPRNRLDEVKYTLYPHDDFIADVVAANLRGQIITRKKD